jgi:oligopeptide transport system substrate-binding protein
VADYNDPQNYLFLLEARTGQMNYGRYSNPEYDALLEKSSHILDLGERARVLAKAEAMMLADMPIAPTWFDSNRNLVNPIVTGWEGNVENIHRSRFLCLDGAK